MFGDINMSVFVIPGVVLIVLLALFAIVRTVARNWITVAPNMVAVVFGRRYGERGYRVVTGGGFFRIPIIESIQWVDLSLISFGVAVKDVPDSNGVLVSVDGIANVKISSEESKLLSAIERFLSRPTTEVERVAKENLEANLRGIVGTLSVEQLIGERGEFMMRVKNEAGGDLGALGLDVELFNIQNITDGRGYIEALGRKQTAEIIKNAEVGEAEAQRESMVLTAEAIKQGQIAKAKADELVSTASRERDVVMAQNAGTIQAEQARVEIRAQQAAAEERAILNEKDVAAEQA
ncbi:MAG: flotillin family protein, partial [Actinomycetota bacterium]|nr:flotillin family protein [Actinomycetota bacterium]